MKIYIFDLETVCDNEQTITNREIIQFGIVEVYKTNEHTWNIGRKNCWNIQPRQKITPYCTQLTGIKWRQLKNQPFIEDILPKIFQRYSLNTPWASWGNDPILIEKNCIERNMPVPTFSHFINLSTHWKCMHADMKNIGLKHAMEQYNIPFEGQAHNALTDSENTAKLFMQMFPIAPHT